MFQVVAGLLASTADERILTDSNWKCTSQVSATDKWTSIDFDDKLWPAAVVAAKHSENDIHKVLPGISLKANWIWTAFSGYQGPKIDSTVYCRLTVSGQYKNVWKSLLLRTCRIVFLFRREHEVTVNWLCRNCMFEVLENRTIH